MIADVLTVARKDLREMLLLSGSPGRSLRQYAIVLGVFGILLPVQLGPDLVREPAAVISFIMIALLLTSGMVADGIAGERERHTLETLLASRLSDRSILIGKIVAAIAFGWGLMLASALVGLVVVNVANPGAAPLVYSPASLAVLGGFGLLGAGFVAAGGSLVALRAPTVRQAAQNMNIAIIVVALAPVLILQALPAEARLQLAQTLQGLDWTVVGGAAAAILAALDLLLLAGALARFQRTKLILD